MQEIDKQTEDMVEDAIRDYVETISREDIEKYTKRVGGDVWYNLSNNSPQFITPKGTVIDVAKVYDSSTMKTEHLTHGMYERLMAKEIIKDICEEYGIERPSYFAYMQNSIGEALDDVLLENNYIRINPGTQGVEGRFYCALPEVDGSHLNSRQFDRLLDFFEIGEAKGYKGVLVYIGDDLKKFAFDEDYGAREAVKDVKRYYMGRIREKLIEERKKRK